MKAMNRFFPIILMIAALACIYDLTGDGGHKIPHRCYQLSKALYL